MLTIGRIDATTVRLTSNDADADNSHLEEAFEGYPALQAIFEQVKANEHGDYDIDVPKEHWADLVEALGAIGGELPGAYEAEEFMEALGVER